jgi:hypothetical protein
MTAPSRVRSTTGANMVTEKKTAISQKGTTMAVIIIMIIIK